MSHIVFVLQAIQPISCRWQSVRTYGPKITFVLLSSTLAIEKNNLLAKEFDSLFVVPKLTYDAISSIIENIIYNKGHAIPYYFVTNDQYCLLLVNQLQTHYQQTNITPDLLKNYVDKITMKRHLTKHYPALKLPKWHQPTVKFDIDYNKIINKISFPLIGKVLTENQSYETTLFNLNSELKQWLYDQKVAKRYKKGGCIVEEWTSGRMYHSNLYADTQKMLHPLCVGTYLNPYLEFNYGNPIGSLLLPSDNATYQRIMDITTHVIQCLGIIPNITYHLECVITEKNELVFLDIAMNSPTGLLARITEQVIGIDIEVLSFIIQFNTESPIILKNTGSHAFWCWLPKAAKVEDYAKLLSTSRHSIEWQLEFCNVSKQGTLEATPIFGVQAYHDNFETLEQEFLSLNSLSTLKK